MVGAFVTVRQAGARVSGKALDYPKIHPITILNSPDLLQK
jgi:hypothetical protein